jgi:hypothetical protein
VPVHRGKADIPSGERFVSNRNGGPRSQEPGLAPRGWSPYTGARSSPVRSFATSGNFSGSGTSQSMQRNFRPPVLTNINRISLRHFEHVGGWRFLGMGNAHAVSGGSTTKLSVTDYCRGRDGEADACRQHANQVMQVQLRELADKFIVRALEIESKSMSGTKLSGPR